MFFLMKFYFLDEFKLYLTTKVTSGLLCKIFLPYQDLEAKSPTCEYNTYTLYVSLN
jgi:hypothetical protein